MQYRNETNLSFTFHIDIVRHNRDTYASTKYHMFICILIQAYVKADEAENSIFETKKSKTLV